MKMYSNFMIILCDYLDIFYFMNYDNFESNH